MKFYEEYKERFSSDIRQQLVEAKCQPILFIGSGFSQRYANYPNWEDLLLRLAEACPNCKPYSYYKQSNKGNNPKIGQDLTNSYFDWAYSSDEGLFPKDLYSSDDQSIFVKHQISVILKSLDGSLSNLDNNLMEEIALLKNIKPHAIITTNYDDILEGIFPDYDVVVGNDVFNKSQIAIGEIFKIHGCIKKPESLIFNESDYEKFSQTHYYISAKLLTYFIEHPLIFVGYSAQDENIKKILFDVHCMMQVKFDLIPNIYFLDWCENTPESYSPAAEKEIAISDKNYIKIKSISASDFSWVFKAFESQGILENINIKTLRAFMARCHKLVISSIPTKTVNINYDNLNKALTSDDEFFNFFGFGKVDNPEHLNANYPYTMTGIKDKLGITIPKINSIIKNINSKFGVDIKSHDNLYHLKIKTGKAQTSKVDKYSEKMIEIIKNEIDGVDYEIEI